MEELQQHGRGDKIKIITCKYKLYTNTIEKLKCVIPNLYVSFKI